MAVFRIEKNRDYTVMSNHHKNLGLSGQAIFHFRARDLKIRKSASVATLAVLAIVTLPSFSPSIHYYTSHTPKWPLFVKMGIKNPTVHFCFVGWLQERYSAFLADDLIREHGSIDKVGGVDLQCVCNIKEHFRRKPLAIPGAYQTIRYAKKQGKTVINIVGEIDR